MIQTKHNNQGNLQKYCGRFGKMEVTIIKTIPLTHDTYEYVCQLPDPNLPLGLQEGHHIRVFAQVPVPGKSTRKTINRIYTPTSPIHQLGTFSIVFKVYRKSPEFPNGGMMTQHLETLKIGDKLVLGAAIEGVYYSPPGQISIFNLANVKFKRLGLICGGTGTNVMYPILRAVHENPSDSTQVSILVGNKSEEDIIYKKELDEIGTDPKIKVHYTVSKASENWEGLQGRINLKMIQQTMPPPHDDTFIWVCGPPGMDQEAQRLLIQAGYSKNRILIGSFWSTIIRLLLHSWFCWKKSSYKTLPDSSLEKELLS